MDLALIDFRQAFSLWQNHCQHTAKYLDIRQESCLDPRLVFFFSLDVVVVVTGGGFSGTSGPNMIVSGQGSEFHGYSQPGKPLTTSHHDQMPTETEQELARQKAVPIQFLAGMEADL